MKPAAQALPADIWERRAAIDPARSFLVQAPAGSGKTELLIQRYLALLGVVDRPESILAITFTIKAAAEMRERILNALRQAAAEENLAPGERAYVTRQLALAALERDRTLHWNLREDPARLRIQTIDALCASIVRRMPWMTRFGGVPSVTDRPEPLYREAARETLALIATGPHDQELATLLAYLDADFGAAARLLEAMLPKRDQWLRYLGSGAAAAEARSAVEGSLSRIVDSHLRHLAALIPPPAAADWPRVAAGAASRLPNTDRDLARCAGLTAMPAPTGADLPLWLGLTDLVLKRDNGWRENITVRDGFPPNDRAAKSDFHMLVRTLQREPALPAALAALRELPEPRFAPRQAAVLDALFRVLPLSAAQLKLVFARRGQVDFLEIAEAARFGLGSPSAPTDLALAMGERFEHILLDEAQDTSVSQIELLTRLTAGAEGSGQTLFVVGDPMQSIYRFREAEVGLFFRMREEGLGPVSLDPLRLTANFRSQAPIVDWVNRAFDAIMPPADDPFTGAISYSPSEAFDSSTKTSAVTIHPLFTADPAPEAALVADLIQQSWGSIAILVRSRTHVPPIAAELRRRGIAYEAVEQDPLASRPVVRDLEALTRALLHPADRPAWLAILRAPWCGLGISDLYALATADRDKPIPELLRTPPDAMSPDGQLRATRLLAILEPHLAAARRTPLRDLVESTWHSLQGEALVSEVEQGEAARYLDLVESLEHAGSMEDFTALRDALDQLYAEPETKGAAVQILTIHKAKGLEFDTVIVPGLARRAQTDDRQLLVWQEVPAPGGTELLIAPMAGREERSSRTYDYLARLEKTKERNESARLLYVAATRARANLHLVGHAESNGADLREPSQSTLLGLLWPLVRADFERMFHPAATAEDSAAPPRPREVITRRVVEMPTPAEVPLPDSQEPRPTYDWVGPTLRHTGTVIHDWLRRIATEGLDHWTTARITQSRPAFRAALASAGVAASDLDHSTALVTRALQQTLSDPRGQWILSPHAHSESELPLTISTALGLRAIVIDRTFVADGARWIIDYKTSLHEGADLEEFLDQELQRYTPQLDAYTRALELLDPAHPIRRALYFPLLNAWRECPRTATA